MCYRLGLMLLFIWLIEYDRDFQRAAATRLPVPVIISYALLAIGGLGVWALYLISDAGQLARGAVIVVAVVAGLGLIMAARWIPVRRALAVAKASNRPVSPRFARMAERNFPVPVVVAHGVLALATIVLVLASTLTG